MVEEESSTPQQQAPADDRTSMAGMIGNANKVLESALDPKNNGVPRELFAKAKGICLISLLEAGFIFSGNLGTGIILSKQKDGTWSSPCAVGLAGVGFGFMVGASHKDLMIFLFDEDSVQAMAGDAGFKFGGQGEVTLGPIGRSVEAGLNLSNKGVGGSCTVAFTKGCFGGISLESAALGPRAAQNQAYYNKEVSPHDILFGDTVKVPQDDEAMKKVYQNLALLAEGETKELPQSLLTEEALMVEIKAMEIELAAKKEKLEVLRAEKGEVVEGADAKTDEPSKEVKEEKNTEKRHSKPDQRHKEKKQNHEEEEKEKKHRHMDENTMPKEGDRKHHSESPKKHRSKHRSKSPKKSEHKKHHHKRHHKPKEEPAVV